MRARNAAFSLLFVASSGCAIAPGEPPIEEAASSISVQDAADTTCSTVSVKGLSEQIVAKAGCIAPGAYVAVPERPNLALGGAVFAYLEEPARDALVDALDAHPDTTMTVNSMLRTVAQQYLLHQWYLDGACGIGLAAKPGSSNHETGLALDVSEYGTWRATLENRGFVWLGSSDPVHFDYAGPDAVDYKGTDVLAFQKLWNDNHPEDLIDEDGVYGPQTEARIQASPADGFPVAPSCGEGGSGGTGGMGTITTTTTITAAGGSDPGAGGAGGSGGSDEEGGGGGAVESETSAGQGCACSTRAPREPALGSAFVAAAIVALTRRRRRRPPPC